MEIPLFCQMVCVGVAGLILLGLVLRGLVHWQRRTNDPLSYLRGKSREEIHQILHTPVYEMPPKDHRRSKRKTKQTHREQ
jgi:hypothetical protein